MGGVYTYSEARQNLAALLDQAGREGEVRVRRRDGSVFVIKPDPSDKSPLNIAGIGLGLSADEIVQFVREGRRTYETHEEA